MGRDGQRGHQCWTAGAVGLATARDDALTVWATSHRAALVSTDREFGQRRMRNAVGHHLWLRCLDWEARDVLAGRVASSLASSAVGRIARFRVMATSGLVPW
jgi:hypothetical protein